MNALSIIITLISVVAGVLQIILFFKVWGMCNDVADMKEDTLRQQTTLTSLIFLHKTKNPAFEQELVKRIYDDMVWIDEYYSSDEYKSRAYDKCYAMWESRCEYYKWEFPESLQAHKTWDSFVRAYLYQHHDIR